MAGPDPPWCPVRNRPVLYTGAGTPVKLIQRCRVATDPGYILRSMTRKPNNTLFGTEAGGRGVAPHPLSLIGAFVNPHERVGCGS